MAQEKEALFLLTFADGTEGSADARDAAAVLRGYAVPAPAIRSSRVFDMVVEYVEKHNAHRSGQAVDRDIDDWDRRFIARAAGDTDALHDLFLVRLISPNPHAYPLPSLRYHFVGSLASPYGSVRPMLQVHRSVGWFGAARKGEMIRISLLSTILIA
jgi:hypothetical protein